MYMRSSQIAIFYAFKAHASASTEIPKDSHGSFGQKCGPENWDFLLTKTKKYQPPEVQLPANAEVRPPVYLVASPLALALPLPLPFPPDARFSPAAARLFRGRLLFTAIAHLAPTMPPGGVPGPNPPHKEPNERGGVPVVSCLLSMTRGPVSRRVHRPDPHLAGS
jgi:hypothetical protein